MCFMIIIHGLIKRYLRSIKRLKLLPDVKEYIENNSTTLNYFSDIKSLKKIFDEIKSRIDWKIFKI